ADQAGRDVAQRGEDNKWESSPGLGDSHGTPTGPCQDIGQHKVGQQRIPLECLDESHDLFLLAAPVGRCAPRWAGESGSEATDTPTQAAGDLWSGHNRYTCRGGTGGIGIWPCLALRVLVGAGRSYDRLTPATALQRSNRRWTWREFLMAPNELN